MNITLTNDEFDVINDLLNLSEADYNKKIGNEYLSYTLLHDTLCIKNEKGNYIMQIKKIENISKLRDVFGNYLMISNSFDEDYNATKSGNAIENLIDKLFMN